MRLQPTATTETLPSPALRRALFGLAGVLGALAVWVLGAEILRAPLHAVPSNIEQAVYAATHRARATWAAWIGLVRGDLWTESALTFADQFWRDTEPRGGEPTPLMIARAHKAAQRAVILAPHDARAWLMLASLDTRFDWLNRKSAGALRMSYYTGFNELDLIPVRLIVAVRSDALDDGELQDMVRREIRLIITRRPDLRPILHTAYNEALPWGRRFIERTLHELDPSLLATIKDGVEH
jgi:hypothetical protein